MVLCQHRGVRKNGGDRQKDQYVEDPATNDGIEHQFCGERWRKVKFFSCLRNCIESLEEKWSKGYDGKDTDPCGPVLGEEGV